MKEKGGRGRAREESKPVLGLQEVKSRSRMLNPRLEIEICCNIY